MSARYFVGCDYAREPDMTVIVVIRLSSTGEVQIIPENEWLDIHRKQAELYLKILRGYKLNAGSTEIK